MITAYHRSVMALSSHVLHYNKEANTVQTYKGDISKLVFFVLFSGLDHYFGPACCLLVIHAKSSIMCDRFLSVSPHEVWVMK